MRVSLDENILLSVINYKHTNDRGSKLKVTSVNVYLGIQKYDVHLLVV